MDRATKNGQKWGWVPNGITALRSLAIPPFLYLFSKGMMREAVWVLAFAYITDFFDGWFARKLKISSSFGNRFDKITDLALNSVAVTALVSTGIYPFWIAYVIIISMLVFYFTEQVKFSSANPMWKSGGFILSVSNVIVLAGQRPEISIFMSVVLGIISFFMVGWSLIHTIRLGKFE